MPVPDLYRAFGLLWSADTALDGFSPAPDATGAPDVVVRRAQGDLPDRGDGSIINRGVIYPDGVRFTVGDEVTLDMFEGARIEWRPGPGWTGTLPLPFFSTITAMVLAWRGGIPIHGSAVEIGGRGIMICGKSGQGKSSTAAGLVAAGGRLISDDLSLIIPGEHGAELIAGRPAVRLHHDTAGFMPPATLDRPSEPTEIKTLVWPHRVADDARVPLDTVIVLTATPTAQTRTLAAPLLAAQMFRPKWLAKLERARDRRAAIVRLAPQLRLIELAPPAITDEASFHAAAAAVLALVSA